MPLIGFAQKIDTTFYTSDWKPLPNKTNAVFYGTKQRINDSTVLIRDYYLTDTIQNTGQYINGVKKGRWTYYYPNGKIKSDFEFINNGKNKQWFIFDEESLTPDKEGVYHSLNHRAKFMGQVGTPNDYIRQNFTLPEKARKKEFISFDAVYQITIDSTGQIIKATESTTKAVLNKKGEYDFVETGSTLKYGVAEALTKFLLAMPKWQPATVKDKPVKSAHNIYIKYHQ